MDYNFDEFNIFDFNGSKPYKIEKPIQLKMTLDDILEKNVNEKYEISDKMLDCFLEISRKNINSSFNRYEKFMRNFNDDRRKIISSTITTRTRGRIEAQYISNKSNEETRKYLDERKRRKESKNKIINTI